MKSISSILRASFVLVIVSFFGTTGALAMHGERKISAPPSAFELTPKTETPIDSLNYKAGVLIGDYLSVITVYLLVLILRCVGRMQSTRVTCIHKINPERRDDDPHAQLTPCDCPFHVYHHVDTDRASNEFR